MADDQRVYSDEEFAVILRTAAEMSNQADRPGFVQSGLTLAEMKSAAAQAGFDPVLVERAARSLTTRSKASPFERLIGGPLRHEHAVHFPVALDEAMAGRLLSAVRISATHYRSMNEGHSSALGMTWQASGEGDTVSLAARPDENGTHVSIVVDRRGTFFLTGAASAFTVFISVLAFMGLYNEIPLLAPWIPVAGLVGAAAAVRGFWSSSTRKVRARIDSFMEDIGRTLDDAEKQDVE